MTGSSQVGFRFGRCLTFALLGVLVAIAANGADDWEETRTTLIDPLNSFLHGHWPKQLHNRDLDVLVRFYATDTGTGLQWDDAAIVSSSSSEETLRWAGPGGREKIRDRYAKLLSLFSDIHRADLRIGRVDWRHPDPLGYRTTVHLIVRGRGPAGELRQLEQHALIRVRYFDPFWEITQEEVTERTLVSLDAPRFEWATDPAGIVDVHENRRSPPFRLFGTSEDNPVRQGSGAAVADVDGDGCEDLLLAGSPDLTLYRGHCDGTFSNVTAESGLPQPYPAAAGGVVFFDYDNDGWADLFVSAVAGGDRLFRNDSQGHFVDVSGPAGIPPGRWGGMPAIADYDRDGFLDIYVSRMGDHERRAPRPAYDARNGERGTLLRNAGDGTFEDVSQSAGVDSPGWDMAAAWGDYDGDGWPDLYVANEFGNNRLYRNDRDGTFTNRTKDAGVTDGGSAMGAAWGDFDGDSDLDLFVSGMHSNSGWALFHPDFPMPIPWHFRLLGLFTDAVEKEAEIITDRLLRGSTLFRNEGNGTFVDISDSAGVRDAQWGWAADFLDYDNDGLLDIYAVNGFITGPLEDDL